MGKVKKIIRNILKPVHVNVEQRSAGRLLEGKNILVTGGASGIGYQIALASARQGANVIICSRNEQKLIKAKDEIIKECGDSAIKIEYVVWDITDIAIAKEKLNECIAKVGKIDCLVNDAGITKGGNYQNINSEDFDSIMNTNLRGTYFLTNEIVKYWVNNNIAGNIVTISSETANCADTNPYAMSKAALNIYIKGLAYELVQHSIRSNGIAPGITVSNINKRENNETLSASTIIGRLLKPEEIAETAIFLLSDLSKCINGEIITCDGGDSIQVEYFR